MITKKDVARARARAILKSGQPQLIKLNRKAGSGKHTDEQHTCYDAHCICYDICPAEPDLRGFMDILSLIEDDDAPFEDGMENGYMSFYDKKCSADMPAMTGSGLLAFLTTVPDGMNPRFHMGYVAGVLIALGESNPAYTWESDEPPEERANLNDLDTSGQ
jgi:hypothetical protein